MDNSQEFYACRSIKNKKKVDAANSKQSAAQPLLRTQKVNFDCQEQLNILIDNLKNNKSEVKFAYFLYHFNLISRLETQSDSDYIEYQVGVNFCDNNYSNSKEQFGELRSRLYQICVRRLFSETQCFTLSIKNELQYVGACKDCSLEDTKSKKVEVCPYSTCALITEVARGLKKKPEEIFKILLGCNELPFCNQLNEECWIPCEEDYKFSSDINVDSEAAFAAAFLMESELFRIVNVSTDCIEYQFVPVCMQSFTQNMIKPITDFWNNNYNATTYKFNTQNYTSSLQKHHGEHCKKCDYKQCPDKAAAYIYSLARRWNKDPIALAYILSQENTELSLNVPEDAQYRRFCNIVEELPFTSQSKKNYVESINYIINHNKNASVPFVPLNLAIYSSDDNVSCKVQQRYADAVWFFGYLSSCETKEISMAKTTLNELIDIFSSVERETIFEFTQFELMEKDSDFSNSFPKLIKVMDENKTRTIMIVRGEKNKLKTFLDKYPLLGKKFFSNFVEITDMKEEDVLEDITDRLNQKFTLSDEFKKSLKEFVYIDYPTSDLKSTDYTEKIYEKIIYNHYSDYIGADNQLDESDIPFAQAPRNEKEIYEELDNLIGLTQVKETLHDIAHLVKFNMKIKNGKNTQGLHMVFSGNAGTGKTTVAKLVAEILHSIGYIRQNKCIVCSSQDLIAGYLGQTAIKTTEVCESAYDGVLFIDEAYMLNPYSGNNTDSFKEECIGTLIQQMENNRDRLVVIFAGYTKEMDAFIKKSNSGLASRIFETIEFPDYTTDELFSIFNNIVKKEGLVLSKTAEDKVRNVLSRAKETEINFGNARFARNLFEKSRIAHAKNTRLIESGDELYVLSEQDITN